MNKFTFEQIIYACFTIAWLLVLLGFGSLRFY